MKYSDLKVGQEYNLKKRNLKARLIRVYDTTQPTMYQFETLNGNLHFFNATTPETNEIEPISNDVKSTANHVCNFKSYIGFTDSFKYCIICDKKES